MKWLPVDSPLTELVEKLKADLDDRSTTHNQLIRELEEERSKAKTKLLQLIDKQRAIIAANNTHVKNESEALLVEYRMQFTKFESSLNDANREYKRVNQLFKEAHDSINQSHKRQNKQISLIEQSMNHSIQSLRDELKSDLESSINNLQMKIISTIEKEQHQLQIKLEQSQQHQRLWAMVLICIGFIGWII